MLGIFNGNTRTNHCYVCPPHYVKKRHNWKLSRKKTVTAPYRAQCAMIRGLVTYRLGALTVLRSCSWVHQVQVRLSFDCD